MQGLVGALESFGPCAPQQRFHDCQTRRCKCHILLKQCVYIELMQDVDQTNFYVFKDTVKGSLQKNWIFYDNELISIATYPPYLIMT